MFNEAVKITQKLNKMSWQQLANYRARFSYDPENESIHEGEGDHKAESTACCAKNNSKNQRKFMTEEEELEEKMKKFVEKQKKIKANNIKPAAGGWAYT